MIEDWKQIPGYDWRYEISDQGNVRSWVNNYGRKRKTPKTMKPHDAGAIYLNADLSKEDGTRQCPKIHRLVAEVFIKKVAGKDQVNHINGVKTDNRAANLEWCTNSENQIHSYKNGITKRKLTPEIVKEIRHLYAHTKTTQQKIAEYFGVDQSHICDIVNYKKWSFV